MLTKIGGNALNMNKTQEQFIIDELYFHNKISRNLCLKNYITRLGAIIHSFKKEKGWKFEGMYVETESGKDYVYFLIN